MQQKNYKFIAWSCVISPNVLDWIRSIYFSLLGSSMLTFWLKVTVLSPLALSIFALGVLAFWVGLFVSVSIANNFKRHEKNYDGTESVKNVKKPETYYYEQEIDTKHPQRRNVEHFLLYFIWIPAFACIAYAGFYMESKSAKSNSGMKEDVHRIRTKIGQLDSAQTLSFKIAQRNEHLQDTIRVINFANDDLRKHIDSLKKVIKALKAKQNPSKFNSGR